MKDVFRDVQPDPPTSNVPTETEATLARMLADQSDEDRAAGAQAQYVEGECDN